MAGEVASYGFGGVVALVSGVRIGGFAEVDNAISIERNVDTFSMVTGADGDSVALQSADRTGIGTLRLLQVSESNAYLMGLYLAQEAGGLKPFPFVVRDTSGKDLAISDRAFVMAPPQVIYGAGHNVREWRVALADVEIFAGGA